MQNDNLLNMFKVFSEQGITETEVNAAAAVLGRELGRKPTVYQIAEYLDDLIRWRHYQRKWKNNELEIRYAYTSKGKKIRSIEVKVNNLFMERG